MKKSERIFSKRWHKNIREKEGSGDETTLIGVCAHVEVHTTHFSLHMQSGSSQGSLEDSIKLSFFFLKGDKKNSASRQGHWPPNRCIALFGTSTVSEHSKLRNLSFHDKRQCIESVALRPAPPWAAPLVKLNNSTSQTSVSSRLCFYLASLRVRFSIRALPSIPQFIISFQTTHHLLSKNLFPLQKHCKGASTSPWWFGKFVFLVSLDWFFAQAMWEIRFSLVWQSLMYSSVDDESRGDSIFQFACFLFHVIELVFPQICF